MTAGHGEFAARYGPWGVVAGASEGLGLAFSEALAARGVNVLMLARRAALLEERAEALRRAGGVEVRTAAVNLAAADAGEQLRRLTSDLDVGLAIYNAAFAPVGAFVDRPLDDLLRAVDVNVRGPVVLAHTLAPALVRRGRGGLVLMASLAGQQGTPRLAVYAASKAFNIVLAEGLWHELRRHGVDVLATCAGAIRTPGYAGAARREAPGTLDAAAVVEATLAALGAGPRVVPGWVNRFAAWLLGRVLPRRAAVAMMASSTRELS